MCGIAGIHRWKGEADDPTVVGRMLGALERRGPDGSGIEQVGPVVLGHRRLAILDLTEAGHQPMWCERGRLAIAFNGEIYNFADLKQELGLDDRVLRSRTDTEVLLHAWARWGPDALDRLVGQFAFALYDREEERLWLARDRFGEKPLFFHANGDAIAFASTLRALLGAPWVPREIDRAALGEYLTLRYVVSPRTVLADCRKLPPGHLLTADRAGFAIRRWYEPRFRRPRPGARRSSGERAEEFGALLEQASRRCLVSDVPVALLLSDGIDSHAIRASLGGASAALPCFTYRMATNGERGVVPSPGGEAARFDVVVSPDQRIDALTAAFGTLNEPVGDGASLATWLLIGAAREHATVFLCGHGGDELLGGYRLSQDRFRLAAIRRLAWLPSSSLRLLIESKVFGAEPAAVRQRAVRRASRAEVPAAARYLIHRPLPAADLASLLDGEATAEPYLESIDRLYADCGAGATDVDRIQEVMIRSFLAENILTFADSVAMDHSAELRMPFLDRDLAEFVLSSDSAERVSPWPGRANTKRILRRWARGRVPDEVLVRRKHGFNYGGLGELLAANGGRLRSLLLDGGPVRRVVPGLERWLAGSADGIRGAQETSLWALLALAAWADAADVR